jgi:iron-only hydrogenase group A
VVTIAINGVTVKAHDGETILSALRANNVSVPTLCHMPDLNPSGACRLCVVEVEGQRGLVPSCSFPVSEGMTVRTHSPRVLRARKTIVELLLANHPQDCLYCDRNGACELQSLAVELGIREKRFAGERVEHKVDSSSPSIVRDPSKCILCGRCVRVCEEIQTVSAIDFINRGSKAQVGTAFGEGLNVSSCINCGQCIMVCPTGALSTRDSTRSVLAALSDPTKHVVVQHAPSVSVTVGEEFGFKPGVDVAGVMTAALRRMGFKRVFDTSFTADLTVMEEASELVARVKAGGPLPLMTSCSPGWVKFVEQFYPEFIPNVSSCKSPQQMLGALMKTVYAEQQHIEPSSIYSVSIMPCTAKKFEAGRPEMGRDGLSDVDAVLTTRELVQLIRLFGIDLHALQPQEADSPYGARSTAGKLFGASGGVTEAALRTAHYLLTGTDMDELVVEPVRTTEGVREMKVTVAGLTLGIAVATGLGNARRLLEEIRQGRNDIHFIEVMTCPGGCIAGGGQPLGTDKEAIQRRAQGLYALDRRGSIRTAHANQAVKDLYTEYLGAPLSDRSHHLLHTHYAARTETIR